MDVFVESSGGLLAEDEVMKKTTCESIDGSNKFCAFAADTYSTVCFAIQKLVAEEQLKPFSSLSLPFPSAGCTNAGEKEDIDSRSPVKEKPRDRHVQWRAGTADPVETLSQRRRAVLRYQMICQLNQRKQKLGTLLQPPSTSSLSSLSEDSCTAPSLMLNSERNTSPELMCPSPPEDDLSPVSRSKGSRASRCREGPVAGRGSILSRALPQHVDSMRQCIEWANLLPATCLHDLQNLLYRLHLGYFCHDLVEAWQPLEPPLIFDVRHIYAASPGEYRWWHVRFNYVLTYSSHSTKNSTPISTFKLDLVSTINTLIKYHGPETLVKSTTYISNEDRKAIVPTGMLLPDLVPLPSNQTPHSTLYTSNRLSESATRRQHHVPLITITNSDQWRECIRVVAQANSQNSLLVELAEEGLKYFD